MKFKMVYIRPIYILVALVVLMALASLTINILILAEAGRFVNSSTAVTVTSLICSALLLTAGVLVLTNSNYLFTEKGLTVLFGCVWYTVPYADIFEVKEHSVTGELFILYREPKSNIPDKTAAAQINIKRENNKAFCDKLKHKSNSALFTLYNPEE